VNDLFAKLGKLLEGGEGGDAEDEKEALSFTHVQFSVLKLETWPELEEAYRYLIDTKQLLVLRSWRKN
jgi:hypothetical protein